MTYATKKQTIQVVNLEQQADVEGVVTKKRAKITWSQVHQPGGKVSNALLTGAVAGATCSITCSDADFTTGTAVLHLGPYKITSNTEYTTGNAATTATNLAAALNRLPEFSAVVNGGDNTQVDVTGPGGPVGHGITFKVVYNGSKTNYTLSPTTGTMTVGGPAITGPTF